MNAIPQFGQELLGATERPGAYAIIADDNGNIFAVVVKGRFRLPGGGIDRREDAEVALRREVLEETDYRVGGLHFIAALTNFSVRKIWVR